MSAHCIIYFVRHGETEWNAKQRIQGHTDIPLNSIGITQSHALGDELHATPFSAAFSSDLSRAKQTAEIIFNKQNNNKKKSSPILVQTSSHLRERGSGQLEGLSKSEYEERIRPFFQSPDALKRETYLSSSWHPEIETTHAVYERVSAFLYTLLTPFTNSSLLVVSHGGVIRAVLDYLHFSAQKRWMVKNCGYIKLLLTEQKLTLLDTHNISHDLF